MKGIHESTLVYGLETSDNIPTYEEQFADYFVKVWRENHIKKNPPFYVLSCTMRIQGHNANWF